MNTWDYKITNKKKAMIITIKGKTKENTNTFVITTDASRVRHQIRKFKWCHH